MKSVFTLPGTVLRLALMVNKSHAQTNRFPSTGAAGIGTLTPNASSLLDITSTTKGILIPRMTLTQRNAIVSPVTGLMIYQTNSTPGFYYYSGSAWVAVSAKGVNKSLSNLTSPTGVNVDLLPTSDSSTNIGSSSVRWKDLNLFNLKFSDGTTETTAGWSLTGNAGTNPATNFIGTTDNQPLLFQVNGVKSGFVEFGSSNTS